MDMIKKINEFDIENIEKQNEEVYQEWEYCFQALDYSLNSPESIAVPDDIRTILEITMRKLEYLMKCYYGNDSIKETETRA